MSEDDLRSMPQTYVELHLASREPSRNPEGTPMQPGGNPHATPREPPMQPRENPHATPKEPTRNDNATPRESPRKPEGTPTNVVITTVCPGEKATL